MIFKSQLLCVISAALLMLSSASAFAESEFQFLLEPVTDTLAPNGTTSANLILRETFDGNGSELFDSTDGPGLFSFSVSIAQGNSTQLSPATISSVDLNSSLDTSLSSVNLIGPTDAYTSVDIAGAIALLQPPLTDGPATGLAGVLDLQLASLNLTASSSFADTTEFLSSLHPQADIFQTLDGMGGEIDVTFGNAGQLNTVLPEPSGASLLAIASAFLFGMRRRRR